MKLVKEYINFERGGNPLDVMKIGNEFQRRYQEIFDFFMELHNKHGMDYPKTTNYDEERMIVCMQITKNDAFYKIYWGGNEEIPYEVEVGDNLDIPWDGENYYCSSFQECKDWIEGILIQDKMYKR